MLSLPIKSLCGCPSGVQLIVAGGASGLARLGGSAKFQIEHMLVRKRLGDNLDVLAGGWGKFIEPGDPATLSSAVAQELDLDDVPALEDRAGTIEGTPLVHGATSKSTCCDAILGLHPGLPEIMKY